MKMNLISPCKSSPPACIKHCAWTNQTSVQSHQEMAGALFSHEPHCQVLPVNIKRPSLHLHKWSTFHPHLS
jgi:hypothetical protein